MINHPSLPGIIGTSIDHAIHQRTAMFEHLFNSVIQELFRGESIEEQIVETAQEQIDSDFVHRTFVCTRSGEATPDQFESLIVFERALATEEKSGSYPYESEDFSEENGTEFKPVSEVRKQFIGYSSAGHETYDGLKKTTNDLVSYIGEMLAFLPDERFEATVQYGTLREQLAEGEGALWIRLKKTNLNCDLPEEVVHCFWAAITIRTAELYNV